MSNKTKLELTWIGKDEEIKAEPRILLYDKENSYGEEETENMLIHGDNLLALKALEQDYAGKIKCIYIDPPFNTGGRINADGTEIGYEDGIEHSIWLNMMYNRFKILNSLLKDDGVLFIHLDDNESDYCKIILDEIFGRKNFMNRVTVGARSPSAFSVVNPGMFVSSEHILYYAKNRKQLIENHIKTPRTPDYAYDKWIENFDSNYSEWEFITLQNAFKKYGGKLNDNPISNLKKYNKFIINNAERICRFTAISDSGAGQVIINGKKESLDEPDKIIHITREKYDDVYILNGQQIAFYSKNISIIDQQKVATVKLTDIWTDIAWEGIANEGGVKFKKSKKPEKLIKRCLELTTNEGDLVLDSFLGSGTTAAVAHKMGRKYIGIELGDHCYTHCKVRLDKVVDGEQGGISKSVNWTGGGGYKFYELAPSLIKTDNRGNMVIDEDKYNPNMLAAAVAKLHGYKYSPDDTVFWKQGIGEGKSFIFTTSEFIDGKKLDEIIKEINETEQLLICCSAFEMGIDKGLDNIEIKKIPQSVLKKCEYSKDNYNLNIIDTTEIEEDCEEWEDE